MILDEAAFDKQFNSHRLQQLDKNIFFGSLPSLNDLDALKNNNIRFFIGIDIPTETMSQIYTQSNICNLYSPNGTNDIIMINFDTSLMPQQFNVNDPAISCYINNNAVMLNKLTEQLNPEIFNTKNIIYGSKRNYTNVKYNVFQLNNYDLFERLNDWLELFKCTGSGVLIFGDRENNETLIALLISCVIKKSSNLKIMDAFQFIKSLKNDSNDNIQEQKIYWNSGLLSYYEMIRKNSMTWTSNGTPSLSCGSSLFQNKTISPNKRRVVNLHQQNKIPISPTSPLKEKGNTVGSVERCKRARSD